MQELEMLEKRKRELERELAGIDARQEELSRQEKETPDMKSPLPVMLTLREAAEKTGLSYHYLRKLCMTDRIVYIRAGNKYLINFDKLIGFLNSGEGARS